MDMEHIKPSTMSTFHAILYSPPHFMSFIDHTLMLLLHTHNCDRGLTPGQAQAGKL
jgi:hypothetical protein